MAWSNDRRVEKNQKLILDAYYQLVQEKGLYNVNLTEVARRANVSRNTIYANFQDQAELRACYIQKVLGEWLDACDTGYAEDRLEKALTYIKEHKEVFRTLYRTGLLESNLNYVLEREYLDHFVRPEEDSIANEIQHAILMSSISGLFLWWIHNCDQYSVQEALDTFLGIAENLTNYSQIA